MSFMQKQITHKQTWVELDGTQGKILLPLDVLSMDEVNAATETRYDISESTLNEVFGKYYEGTIQSTSIRIGFGVRLSAPGYMDCTDWDVFDTEEEAEVYIEETYSDDEDDTEDEEG